MCRLQLRTQRHDAHMHVYYRQLSGCDVSEGLSAEVTAGS